jgi:glucosamine--fructose-6-phosphate aminotransferase (isomerizing)
MCGIIGYCGKGNAIDAILEGLHALEYRGYDSAGVAYFDRQGALRVVKAEGKIRAVEAKLAGLGEIESNTGIGHTRWATHGAPSDRNSHPHGTARVQIVHNGIIENYTELRRELEGKGYTFASDTDTETAALLIDSLYTVPGDRIGAIRAAESRLRGAFAIGVVFSDEPGVIYAIRRDNPLIVGLGEGENFIASDITAILGYTRRYVTLEPGELAIVRDSSVTFLSADNAEIEKTVLVAAWDAAAAAKGGYAHFMRKEIHEEPTAVKATLSPRMKNGLPDFSAEGLDEQRLASVESIRIVACGTAYHAGLIGKYIIEKYARIPVVTEIASEFRYADPIVDRRDLVIVISQSGETADTLAALRLAKQRGAYTVGVVNAVGSTIARETDATVYTYAGPEIAVASTKAYTVQTALLTLLGLKLAALKGTLSEAELAEGARILTEALPKAISAILEREEEIAEMAGTLVGRSDLFFIGRQADGYAAAEASLKLKEISYMHSEAYAAGELKHGTISLIEEKTPVIALSTDLPLREKMVSNIKEVAARGAEVITFAAPDADTAIAEVSDQIFYLPEADPLIAPIAMATALQLLAYHVAAKSGCDVDQPRNLAKSVTVE